MDTNLIYYGDNLSILRDFIPDQSIDLVYLDPPFNSQREWNLIFQDESGNNSDAQLLAFDDNWHWGPSAEDIFSYLRTCSIGTRSRPVNSLAAFKAAWRNVEQISQPVSEGHTRVRRCGASASPGEGFTMTNGDGYA